MKFNPADRTDPLFYYFSLFVCQLSIKNQLLVWTLALHEISFNYCLIHLLVLFYPLQISDISVEDYITATAAKHPTFMPHTAGRYQAKRFRKAQCPIIERLTNSLMMHGRNNGKKLMAVRIIKHAMEIIHLLTDLNPIQVIVDAVINRSAFPWLYA